MKVKPHNLELEQMVLGALLMESSAMVDVVNIITTHETFYHVRHQNIWQACCKLYHNNEPIDTITITAELRKDDKYAGQTIGQIGTELYAMQNMVGGTGNISTWCFLLKELYIKRTIIELCQKHALDAYQESTDAIECYDNLLTDLGALQSNIVIAKEETMADVVDLVVSDMRKAEETKEFTTGIKTTLDEVDAITSGFQNSDFIVIAARPAMGKSAFAMHIAKQQAKHFNKKIAVFSLEMSRTQLVQRLLAADAEVKLETIRHGGLSSTQWENIDSNAIRMKAYPIYIYDNVYNIKEIIAISKMLKLKYGIDEIIIDYLQLIGGGSNGKRGGNREQELSGITRDLKMLAKQLNIPVVALSQLSRKVEERSGKKPMLSDLRESGAIEQDTDIVIFLHREFYYNPNTPEPDLVDIIFAKHRNGKTGEVNAYFYPDYQLFTNSKKYFRDEEPF